jgi:hypothetical protein
MVKVAYEKIIEKVKNSSVFATPQKMRQPPSYKAL